MARPAALADQQEHVTVALTAIEAAPPASVYAAPLVVLSLDRPPRPVIGVHAGGRTVRLDIDETILVAVALELQQPFPEASDMARGLRSAAGMADLLELGHRMRLLRSGPVQPHAVTWTR